MKHPEKCTILIVEDEPAVAQLERQALESSGFIVEIVDCGNKALQRLEHDGVSLILLDYRLPDMNGKEIVRALGERIVSIPVVVVTGYGDEQLAVEMLKMGVSDYMVKGASSVFFSTLIKIVQKSIDDFAQRAEHEALQAELHEREKTFRKIFDSLPDPALLWERQDHGYITLTGANRKSLDLSSGEIADKFGMKLNEYYQNEPEISKNIVYAMNTGDSLQEERFLSLSALGEERWMIVDYTKFKKDGVMVSFKDITTRKTTEDMLRQSREELENGVKERTAALSEANILLQKEVEERKRTGRVLREYRKVVESSDDPIIVINRDYVTILTNEAFLRHFNIKRKQVIGREGEVVFGEKMFRNSIKPNIDRCMNRRQPKSHVEIMLRQYDHDNRHMQMSYYPIKDANDEITSVVIYIKDITELKRAELAYMTFKVISDRAGYGAVISDLEGNLIYVNESFARMHGYSEEDLLSKNLKMFFDKKQMNLLDRLSKRLLKNGGYFTEEIWHRKLDGTKFPSLMTGTLIIGETGAPCYLSATAIDISQRKQIEEALKDSEERYRLLVETSPDAIILTNMKGSFISANLQAALLYGFGDVEEMLRHGKTTFGFIIPEERPRAIENMREILEKGISRNIEYTLLKTDGSTFPAEMNTSVIMDAKGKPKALIGVIRNITERKRAEELTKRSLQEKEILLKEIHHRVKNNLQIISSLLNLQAEYVRDKPVLEMFRDSQNRVRSMALIHEKLYRSDDLARIDFAEYIRDITTNLFQSYKVSPTSVNLSVMISNVFMMIDMAIPLGLIVNELVSNSLKYAFPSNGGGVITIDFCFLDKNRFKLCVCDNGIGLPDSIDFRDTTSLGLQLVNTLVKQINGQINVSREGGTRFDIIINQQELLPSGKSHVKSSYPGS